MPISPLTVSRHSLAVNQFATQEGVPAAMDPMIDQFVNKEV
jgi:hypothetical protein